MPDRKQYKASHKTNYRRTYHSRSQPPTPMTPVGFKKNEPTEDASFGLKELFLLQLTICCVFAMGFLVVSMADADLSNHLRSTIATAIRTDGDFSLPSGATYVTEDVTGEDSTSTTAPARTIPTGDFLIDDNVRREIQEANQ